MMPTGWREDCEQYMNQGPSVPHAAISSLWLLSPACLPAGPPRRCIAQLSVLGYILVPIFLANRWWITLLYALFMLGVAAVEAVSRPAQSYDGMLLQVRLGGGAGVCLQGPHMVLTEPVAVCAHPSQPAPVPPPPRTRPPCRYWCRWGLPGRW